MTKNNDQFDKKREGDGYQMEQFLDLLTANHNKIYAYILGRVPRLMDADDIIQEATVLMWRKYEQFIPGTNFLAWGKAFANFCILQHRKALPSHCPLNPEVIEALSDGSERMMHELHSRLAALRTCIKKLNESDRELVQMRYGANITVKHIAERSGTSIYNIYRALARTHGRLMRCIRRTLAEEAVS